jgi:hypothetical protein
MLITTNARIGALEDLVGFQHKTGTRQQARRDNAQHQTPSTHQSLPQNS